MMIGVTENEKATERGGLGVTLQLPEPYRKRVWETSTPGFWVSSLLMTRVVQSPGGLVFL